jgi:serine/threonine protein kinase
LLAGVAAIDEALADIDLDHEVALRRVRGYVIEEELGSGAFGTVYRVRHVDRNVTCAMKQLSLRNVALFGATAEEQQAEVQNLNSEAAILSELDHPNVINYHESFQEEGSLYIVMELADGMSLLDFIHSHAEKATKIPEATV